jgi:hypothetical protein
MNEAGRAVPTAEAVSHSGRMLLRLFAVALAAGVGVGVYLSINFAEQRQQANRLFSARFPQSGLITNESAYHNPLMQNAVRSFDWQATSGSLFARNGAGWTGVPDGRAPDAYSRQATDSAVFRLRTRMSDFLNVSVSFQLRLDRYVTTPRTPARQFDGVHVWLRYQSPDKLYFVSVARRDGTIMIGKKLPVDGGRYHDLIRPRPHRFPLGRWQDVQTTVSTEHGHVIIRLLLDGKLIARTTDDSIGGPSIVQAGRVGIRGDNSEFDFRGFQVLAA